MNEHKLQNKISQNPINFLLPLRRNLFNFDIGGYFESEILNTNLLIGTQQNNKQIFYNNCIIILIKI